MNYQRILMMVVFICATVLSAYAQPFVDLEVNITPVMKSNFAWGDYDGDGDLDVIVLGAVGNAAADEMQTTLYRNDDDGIFTRIDASIVDVESGAAKWGDYDNDGDLDLLICGRARINDGGIVTKIYRNDYVDGAYVFVDIMAPISGVMNGSVDWGDYDRDGDLDILVIGAANLSGGLLKAKLYRNDGADLFNEEPAGLIGLNYAFGGFWDFNNDGWLDILIFGLGQSGRELRLFRNERMNTFTEVSTNLPAVDRGTAAFGDFDSDGDEDILITGNAGQANGGPITQIFRNNSTAVFTHLSLNLPGVDLSDAHWGDYDNDGDLDLALIGQGKNGPVTFVLRNDRLDGIRVESTQLVGVANGHAQWVDVDENNVLDLMITGTNADGNPFTTIYTNQNSAENLLPAEPLNPYSIVQGDTVIFRWSMGSDDITSQKALTYNIRVGITPGGNEIVSGHADPNGKRYIVDIGNVGHKLGYALIMLPPARYYWAVQTIDGTYKGSFFSPEQEVIVENAKDGVPVLIKPTNGASDVVNPVAFSWEPVPAATSYNIQVSQDSTFSSIDKELFDITSTETTVYGLMEGRTYFWRVNASNANGTGPYSQIWRFTTTSTMIPTPPQLSSPADDVYGMDIDTKLIWNPVSDAQLYHLQVAWDENFTNLYVDIDDLADTYYQLTGLETGIALYWRVSARNSDGTSNWSDVRKFHVVLNSPSIIQPRNELNDAPTTMTFKWNWVNGAETYHLQVSQVSDFSNPDVDQSNVYDTTYTQINLGQGTTYFWRVAAIDGGGNYYWSESRSFYTFSYPQRIQVDASINFPEHSDPASYQPADYRLVGLPGQSNMSIADALPGQHRSEWDAYWDNGAVDNYFVNFDASDNFRFRDGRAFWVLYKGATSVQIPDVQAYELNEMQQAEIPLHQGWNLITNPFNKVIPWTVVKDVNGISSPIFGFNGGFNTSAEFKPFVGYYYFNSNNSDRLYIPYTAPLAKLTDGDEFAWKLILRASSAGQIDASAWIGVSEQAQMGLDAMDVHKPRALGDVTSIVFPRPEWDAAYSNFASDIRPPSDELMDWEFVVSAKNGASVEITVEGSEELPAELEIYLIDVMRGISQDLQKQARYEFQAESGSGHFRLIIGDDEQVKKVLDTVVPKRFMAEQNYPNPFNMETVIHFAIPTEMDASLKIYNLLGQQVRVLHDGILRPGRYQFTWNGTDQHGRALPSGVYFYRFVSNTRYYKLGKMIMLK